MKRTSDVWLDLMAIVLTLILVTAMILVPLFIFAGAS